MKRIINERYSSSKTVYEPVECTYEEEILIKEIENNLGEDKVRRLEEVKNLSIDSIKKVAYEEGFIEGLKWARDRLNNIN